MKSLLTCGLLALSCTALAQTDTEKMTKTLNFEKPGPGNTLVVANLNGSITIEGYEGTSIYLEATRTLQGKSTDRLEAAKKAVQIKEIDRADTLIVYVEGTGMNFGRRSHNNGGTCTWGYAGCCNNRYACDHCDCDVPYDYRMDFTIKVPHNVNLLVSTVNEGDVAIRNVSGAVTANNINGGIRLTNLVREAKATTINGNVDVEYASNPKADCRFYTLNGDINAWFQKGLAASMSFESFNGSFYTNIDELETMPPTVEKLASGSGMKYKVNDNRYKIGNGGAFLDFETFNGNVYLKEK